MIACNKTSNLLLIPIHKLSNKEPYNNSFFSNNTICFNAKHLALNACQATATNCLHSLLQEILEVYNSLFSPETKDKIQN